MIRRSPLWTMALLLALAGCGSGDDPEARLRQTVDLMETAAEAGDIGEFLEYVADDFSGQGGQLDRRNLARMLRAQMLRHTRITATITSSDIQMFTNRATMDMTLLLTGGPRAWMPESGELMTVSTGWRLSGGDWELISASWER
ncbi:MAG: nuclear transport factor 2 family protein [Xanthomonadales bacterium]|nr:nuclear transport factor 2 family protein [Xanthomonadales bacterium]